MIGEKIIRPVFRRDELPAELTAPVSAEEPDVRVSKRTAKSVAEELTGRLVKVRDRVGCEIEVEFPNRALVFRGPSWWLALRKLNAHLTRQRAIAVPSEL